MKIFLSLILALVTAGSAAGQAASPIRWTYEVKKLEKDKYSLIFHATLDDGYHLFSQEPGGDGFLIPPSFEYDDKVKKVGKTTESGKLIHEVMDGVDGRVHYYEHKVDFTQEVMGRPGSKVTVKHGFQICNATTCLPPKSLEHTFTLLP